MTSERWLPLVEVNPRDLPTYLMEMREAGYTLVGEWGVGSGKATGVPVRGHRA